MTHVKATARFSSSDVTSGDEKISSDVTSGDQKIWLSLVHHTRHWLMGLTPPASSSRPLEVKAKLVNQTSGVKVELKPNLGQAEEADLNKASEGCDGWTRLLPLVEYTVLVDDVMERGLVLEDKLLISFEIKLL